MKALDTNILVRFLIEDNARMADAAAKTLEEAENKKEPLFVSLLVALELNWVLASCYQFSRGDILDAFDELLAMPALTFEASDCLNRMIALGRTTTLDISDLLIGLKAEKEGCDITLTLDRRALQSTLFGKIM